jgi:type IV pilus assembly protein PilE
MKQNGFSMIELVIVVAIVGLLAAVALPSMQGHMFSAKRSDAYASILEVQLEQQKLRSTCRFYGGAIGAANACGGAAADTVVAGLANSKEGYYNLALTNASGNSYTISAAAIGNQANDSDCPTITLAVNNANPDGLKTPAQCW